LWWNAHDSDACIPDGHRHRTLAAAIQGDVLDGRQRCLHFALGTTPSSRVLMYQDHDGNTMHHYNIPARYSRLTLKAEALVECSATTPFPDRGERAR
jgi:hypothetical protein